MCTSSTERVCVYQIRQFWRRKWGVLFGLLTIAVCVVLMVQLSVNEQERVSHDTSLDSETNDVYESGAPWFNGKKLSRDSPEWGRYMRDLRRDWILWKYDSNKSYNLAEPEIKDQSMGQAEEIRKILKDKVNGFFVECGAYDGETRSNTLVLERYLGWTGLLVEADPLNFSKMLLKNRKAYLTPTCLAIRPYPSVSSFLMAKNVGRLHEPNATDSHLPNSPDVAYSGVHLSVQCIPFIDHMMALNVTTVNYFSLDIEGNELQVLKTIPFENINIETLSVEFSHVASGKKELISFMKTKGYDVFSSVVRTDKLAHDIIFVKHNLGSIVH
ncbi:uncharacterized protein LOC117221938 isoform X2 [Megalopta genalis]|uniref:uncharacterized protein LOC117221938 isoform X2 n=1 Tax=Megalopta genalis TaxID=115081 RepID=UPI0014437F94|nr:uncharacterized protein LOC117221938 isoform X2 [Megalopta genalis]